MFYEACPEANEQKPGDLLRKVPVLKDVIFMGDIPYNGMFTWEEFLKKADDITMDELARKERSPLL